MVVLAQLSCAYIVAVLWFHEAPDPRKNVGVVFAAAGFAYCNATARFHMGATTVNRAELKTLAEQRKERAILAGNLFKRKVPDGGRRRKGGRGGGKGRFNRRDREEGSSPRQGEGNGGDEAEQSAKKGSKDGSNKSMSTPGKKKFPRGKGK